MIINSVSMCYKLLSSDSMKKELSIVNIDINIPLKSFKLVRDELPLHFVAKLDKITPH